VRLIYGRFYINDGDIVDMSRKITRTPKTRDEEDQEEEAYIKFKRQWEIDQASRRAGTKEKPTPAEMDEYYAAEKASHMRQMHPAPQFGGVDRVFAGRSDRLTTMQASNRGRREAEALAEKRKKLQIAINEASLFIETANQTLASERERSEHLLGINDENLDQLLAQIYGSNTWDDIAAPKPMLHKSQEHNRLALKTYIIDNRRMSDVLREFMNGEDVIRKLIREMSECRDNGLNFVADIGSNPQEHGRDNADGMSIPQPEVLLQYKSLLESKLRVWRDLVDAYIENHNGSMQLTFQEMLTYRQNWKEMRRNEIMEKIARDTAEAAERRPAKTPTFAPVSHSDGVLSIRRDRSPAARGKGPPARKPVAPARNPDPSPAARGPPREGDADELTEPMETLLTSRRKTHEVRHPKKMNMLLQALKAHADV
jgi:hypothetical protein